MQVTNGYIQLPVASDRDTLIQTAFANIATAMPGWRPREGNLDVLLIEEFAGMAAEAATVAASVPLSIFEYYGSLLGITQNTGTTQVISTTWTLTTTAQADTVIPKGTVAAAQYNKVYYQYQTSADLTISAGSVSGTVNMTAVSSGSSYGSIGGGIYLQPLYYIANLSTIQVNSIVTAGIDAESTNTYLDRLANTLTAYTPRPIVSNDYANLASQIYYNSSTTTYPVGRATAYDNANPIVNFLSVAQANPSTSGWSSLNGATLAGSSIGLSVATPTSSGFITFNSAASTTLPSGGTFVPFPNSVTSASGSYASGSTNTISVTNASTYFPNTTGFGFVVDSTLGLVAFKYTGSTTTTLTGVTWGTYTGSTSYASGATISYAGPVTFYGSPSSVISTSSANNYLINLTQSSLTENVFVSGITSQTYNSVTGVAGFTAVSLKNSYAASAITITSYGAYGSLAPGASTGAVSLYSNSCNLIGMVNVQGSTNINPVLVAAVTYKNDNSNTTYYYYSDPTAIKEYASGYNLSVAIPGYNPNPWINGGNSIADTTIPSSFAEGIKTVTFNVYWPGTYSTTHYILLASLFANSGNTSYFQNGVWKTGANLTPSTGTNNPSSIIPDGQFQSIYYGNATTTTTTSGTLSAITSLLITNVANWPSSGVGVAATLNGTLSTTNYFSWTGITYSGSTGTLTGVSFISPGSNTLPVGTSNVTSLNPSSTFNQWSATVGASGTAGTFTPLNNVGVQFTPSATTLAAECFLSSNYFSLPDTVASGSTNYILDATIDATGVTGSSLPTVSVRNAITGTALATITATAGQKQRGNTGILPLASISANTDVYIKIDFPAGMVTSANRSVIVSNLQLVPVANSLVNVTNNYGAALDALGAPTTGPYWQPGGITTWNASTGSINNNVERSVTVAITDPYGMRPSSYLMQSVQNYLDSYREINFNVNVVGPTYQLIDISYNILSAKGYDPSTVETNILNNLIEYLNPANWAGGLSSPPVWDSNQNVIHYLDVVGRLDDADGVANVLSLTIKTQENSSYGTSDITFPSFACLPILANVNGTVISSNSSALEVA